MGRTWFKKGHIPWNKGIPRTTEEKLKIKEAVKRLMENPKVRKRLSETIKKQFKEGKRIGSFTGKHHSEESRIKNRIVHLGNKYALGAKRSEGTKRKISETIKKLYNAGELKPNSTCFKRGNKLSVGKRGPLTEEHKKKLSSIAKKLWKTICKNLTFLYFSLFINSLADSYMS